MPTFTTITSHTSSAAPSSWLLLLLVAISLLTFVASSSASGKAENESSCPTGLWEALWSNHAVTGTLETMFRSFCLGFGARMLKFSFVDGQEDLDRLKERVAISIVAGVSMSSLVLGLSLVVPVRLRDIWF